MISLIEGVVSEPVALSASSGVEQLDARFTELRPTLLGVARSLVGQDSADDVVHDSYLRARGRISQLRDPQALDAWLSRIVVATAFNYHRRRRGLIDRLRPITWHLARPAGIRPRGPTPS